jgi:hypothetical protein
MTSRALFPTLFYEASIDDADLLEEIDASCRGLAQEDRAGRAWSKEHGYRGYTSYASLADGRKLKLDSLWVNVMKPGGTHSGHLHPHSVVSGTFYVAVPEGSGALKLEDPRLAMLMAAPTRPDTFVYAEPQVGSLFLWESWLRHEVMPSNAKAERISVSFNYRW